MGYLSARSIPHVHLYVQNAALERPPVHGKPQHIRARPHRCSWIQAVVQIDFRVSDDFVDLIQDFHQPHSRDHPADTDCSGAGELFMTAYVGMKGVWRAQKCEDFPGLCATQIVGWEENPNEEAIGFHDFARLRQDQAFAAELSDEMLR